MTISEFIESYREAFGDAAPLPIAFAYNIAPATEIQPVPKCIIGAISKVRNGGTLTLSADNVLCGGGGLYTAFRPMPERVPVFTGIVTRCQNTVVADPNIFVSSPAWGYDLYFRTTILPGY